MKKNRMMRIASVLLVAVLLSTCAISGTFAKYVSEGSAADTARVAKWGVEISVSGNDAFATKYENDIANDAGTEVISSESTVNVVAPGTKGTLATFDISGAPEVAFDVIATADIELTGTWKSNDTTMYCPIIFKVEDTAVDVSGCATLDEIEEAVEKAIVKAITGSDGAVDGSGTKATKHYEANPATLTTDVDVTWEWTFEVDEATNKKDTYLGNWNLRSEEKPEIKMSLTVTAEQVD